MPEEKHEQSALSLDFITSEGQKYEVPEEGSLGLLALGYIGLMAWREKRMQSRLNASEENV